MAKIESQSDRSSHRLINSVMPSVAELILYALLSLILLVVFNSSEIISRLGNNYLSAAQGLKANFSTLSSGFSNSFSTALGGRLGQIMLWSFIGALAYIGLWLSKNVLNSFENDVIIDHYLHPSSYNRLVYRGSSFSVKIFLAVMVLLTASYGFLLFTVILPAIAGLAGSASYNFVLSTSPWYILLGIAMGAIALYIGLLLLRLVVHLWQLL